MAARTPAPERLAPQARAAAVTDDGDDVVASDIDGTSAMAPDLRYTVLGELARGGLGRVFTATDDALGRQVAIKQPIGASAEALMRFEREAKLTARLQHAGVVPVYDVGYFADGEPFFVMKMMEGRSLSELIRQAGSPAERLLLLPRVLAVADTMAYAHSRGVIHRDLKPANVIISDYGETVVIDWGLARVCPDASDEIIADDLPLLPGSQGDSQDHDADPSAAQVAAGLTGVGRVLGTPQFMPPEQATGAVVDARADVYALGAILYNVLSGEEPYAGHSSKDAVLDQVRASAPVPVLERAPGLPDDLAAIVETAMAREPERRYTHAGELAQDLRRFLDGQLVTAHRYSPSELMLRWFRRHRAAVTVGAVLLATLFAAAVVGVQRVVAERNAALEARQAALARENVLTLFQAQRSLPLEPTAALAWLKRYRPTPDQAWMARALAEEAAAQGAARHVFRFPVPARAVAVSPVSPAMAVGGSDGAINLYDVGGGKRRELGRLGKAVTALAFAPARPLLAAMDSGGKMRLWSGAGDGRGWQWTLRRERELPGVVASAAGWLTFSSDAEVLAVVLAERTVALLSAADLSERARFQLPARVSALAFCPGSNPDVAPGPLVVTDMAGNVLRLDAGETVPRPLPGRHADVRLVCLPDGRGFVTGGIDGEVRLWDLQKGLLRGLQRHQDWVTTLAISPDGQLVASGSGDDTIVMRRLADDGGRDLPQEMVLRGHEDTVRGLVFSPDGSALASVSFDSSLRIWDIPSGQLLRTTRASRARSQRLWLTSDGRHVVSSGPEQALVWPLEAGKNRLLRGHTDLLVSEEWSADSRTFITGSRDRTVRTWDVATGESRVFGPFDSWPMVARLLDGALLANGQLFVGTRLGTALLVDVATGKTHRLPLGQVDPVGTMGPYIMLSSDRRRLAYASKGQVMVQPVDLDNSGRVALEGHLPAVTDMSWLPDGRRLAVTTRDGVAGIWDVATGKAEELHRLGVSALEVAVTPDQRWAAVLTGHNRLWLWHLPTHEIKEVQSERAPGSLLMASRDSGSFIYKGTDLTIRVLDIASRELRVLRAHRSPLVDMVRAPTSALLASSDESGLIRLWNLETGQTAVLLAQGGAVDGIEYSPDGRWLATVAVDAGVRIWDMRTIPMAVVPTGDAAWLERHTTAVVDRDNQLFTP